jgi:hypothetical protein
MLATLKPKLFTILRNFSKKKHTLELNVITVVGTVAITPSIDFNIAFEVTQKGIDCCLLILILWLVTVYE